MLIELINNLSLGFSVSLTPANLLFCLIGVAIGTAIGVLPGLGPTATLSLLLPITFQMTPVSAIIMLSGIYYGAMYGGSITSILIRIPGEAASVVTCIDGHEMAKRGRAGPALGMSAFASFIAGIVSTIGIAVAAPALSSVAYLIGPVEQTALVTLGLVMVAMISDGSLLRAITSAIVGLLISTVGTDMMNASERFTFGITSLTDGIDIASMAMGLFGISELFLMAEKRASQVNLVNGPSSLRELLPTKQDWQRSSKPIARGTGIGFFLGLLPGAGLIMAPFASYVIERKFSKHREEFGSGAIEGVSGPEAANNAAAQAGFIPLFSLGIPANAVMAVMLGAMMIKGMAPGPQLAAQHPDLFWGTITSMFIGNVMLVILNVPLLRLFVGLLKIPRYTLSPLIIVFCFIGAYSLSNNIADVVLMVFFGVLGYLMRKADYDPSPFLIGFVLGSIFESSLRQSLLIGIGSPLIFFKSPIAATILIITTCIICWAGWQRLNKTLFKSQTDINQFNKHDL